MKAKLPRVARIHRRLCAQAKCRFLATLNYNDPCIGCPEGHFGPYQRAGCPEDEKPIIKLPLKPDSLLKPGDLFGTIIFKITGQRTAHCGVCGTRKAQMNIWGWWGCWRKRKTIIGWLIEEARKRGHSVDEQNVADLFKAAIKELR